MNIYGLPSIPWDSFTAFWLLGALGLVASFFPRAGYGLAILQILFGGVGLILAGVVGIIYSWTFVSSYRIDGLLLFIPSAFFLVFGLRTAKRNLLGD